MPIPSGGGISTVNPDELYVPCGWPQGVCTGSAGVVDADPNIIAAAEAEAAFILWTLTGQQYGQCYVTVEMTPECRCISRCVCNRCVIWLPGHPASIASVLINGELASGYTLSGHQLIRSTGWPTEGVSVTYLRGRQIPPGGERAVRLLATELVRAWCASDACQPPPNLRERTRRGDRQVFDSTNPNAKVTGLPYVDAWVAAANRAVNAGSVWSPDVDRWTYTSGPLAP